MKAHAAFGVKMLALAALLGFMVASVRADDKDKANATGTWKWTRKTPNGDERVISAKFKQEGEKLTGKVMTPMGEVDIKDGKVNRYQVALRVGFTLE